MMNEGRAQHHQDVEVVVVIVIYTWKEKRNENMLMTDDITMTDDILYLKEEKKDVNQCQIGEVIEIGIDVNHWETDVMTVATLIAVHVTIVDVNQLAIEKIVGIFQWK